MMQAEDFKDTLETQMVSFNKHLVALPQIRSELSGSTAITALLESNGFLTVANVGDSRCMLGKLQNGVLKVECLSTDHTPYVPSEASRIISKQVRPQHCPSDLQEKFEAGQPWWHSSDLPRVHRQQN